MGRPVIDMTGEKFGRLVVIRFHHRDRHDTWWLCKCECGKEKSIRRSVMKRGDTVSCGCYARENAREKNRKYPVSNGKTKFCGGCKRFRRIKFFWKDRLRPDGLQAWCGSCSASNQEKNRNRRKDAGLLTLSTLEYRRLRLEVLSYYSGGKPRCDCCGEERIEFLGMDHMDGGGAKHRASLKTSIYRFLKKNNYPPRFRVLCHNCNQSLGQYGYCPHKTKPEYGRNYRSHVCKSNS